VREKGRKPEGIDQKRLEQIRGGDSKSASTLGKREHSLILYFLTRERGHYESKGMYKLSEHFCLIKARLRGNRWQVFKKK